MGSILGIDLAWRGGNNTSAISVAQVSGERTIHITKVYPNITNWQKIFAKAIIVKETKGIAIDAPLIVNNISGQRICEKLLSKEYGGRGASCHSTNLTLYPNSDGVNLSNKLNDHGFAHLNCTGKFQIECYPHPALIEIFSLKYRLKYKKGNIIERRDGQGILADRIMSLKQSNVVKLTLSEETKCLLRKDYIQSLQRRIEIKQNEDALDSIICAYIAGLFYFGCHSKVFGSITDGYIFVPKVRCI
jgi:predicted RNase H-like nuclease